MIYALALGAIVFGGIITLRDKNDAGVLAIMAGLLLGVLYGFHFQIAYGLHPLVVEILKFGCAMGVALTVVLYATEADAYACGKQQEVSAKITAQICLLLGYGGLFFVF